MKKSQFTVTIPAPKVRRLTALAKQDGRSRNNYVANVLDRHLKEVGKAA
jgi:hypothetical protein